MKIVCIGGGPAGLYFGLLMKKLNSAHDITVVERNRPYDTFGWGVVFSDATMESLREWDAESARQIEQAFAHWDDIELRFKGRSIRSGGHGFVGIGRKKLLNILQKRCEDIGVKLVFECEVDSDEDYPDADLVIACDGISSKVRTKYQEVFKPDIVVRPNRFIWLGTNKLFDAFTFDFQKTEHGWFQAHIYKFDEKTSTFIVECPEHTFLAHGLDKADQEQSIAFCEKLFADTLEGDKLMTNARHLRGSAWLNFQRVVCDQWWLKNKNGSHVVLMGDAVHTAHFAIGSGTKLALEDAIELVRQIKTHGDHDLGEVLSKYQELRRVETLRIQNAAWNAMEWFEVCGDRYCDRLEPEQFMYSMLTRSQRISHENLRLRDKGWLEGYERWFADRQGVNRDNRAPAPPMFTPVKLRSMELRNRVVVSPMAMYSAVDGMPTDFHLVHYGARALGGASLVYTEMTCVSPEARITPGCPGIWNDGQESAWRRIVDFVHDQTGAKMCIQIGHSGSKGSTRNAWDGIDKPLVDGNWHVMGPSGVAWTPDNQAPLPMTRADMDLVLQQFVSATTRAHRAGFDMIELHCAHGYLLSGFISPMQNKRTDKYGGSLENRLRYPLEVFRAMRAIWPADKPMSVRISAHDWVGDAGVTPTEAVEISKAFVEAGVDIIDVSSGQVTKAEQPVYGRMFQTPFSDKIRNEVGIPTISVGNIFEPDHVNSIIAAGRADLCAIARPHQIDPSWVLRAAAMHGYDEAPVPKQYLSGYRQLEVNMTRAAQTKR
ncbi:bifunctional salicylyl-CoA 5-hydroxylase/oxidoreductase [Ferrovibrio sp.]|uniref:bifunctional salicylyl-CoA 5-hydroxylase/oxidoreductase n=1 Tax=Ferrovibrio sp. TaxID=1917215 RepID=UPI00262CF780|nr:bifunctional salicylyl-CoA 5-hydroxylase/oxidoreductase [Ferrovibrio sp.]